MNGLLAVLMGLVALIGSLLLGNRSKARKVEKLERKVTTAEMKADLVRDFTPIVIKATERKASSEAEYERVKGELERARRSSDMDAALRIASDLAQRAFALGAKEKE